MSDEDPTWKQRAGDSQRRRDRMGRPAPLVIAATSEDRDDVTSPRAFMERPANEAEREIAEQLRRDAIDPFDALAQAVGKLTHRLDQVRREGDSGNRERKDQLDELLKAPRQLEIDVADLKSSASTVRKVLAGVAIAAVGSLTTVGIFLYSRGFGEGEMKVTIENLKRDVADLKADARRPRDWPGPSSSKATP